MNAARAPGVASSAARSESGVTPCAMPSSGSYCGGTQVGRPPDSTSPSITDACALRWTTTGAPSGASARHNAWLPWVAPLVRNQERAAPYASAASCSARAYGVTPSPRSTPWMSCGMSSLSVCQPIAVRTPRSAPLPALWPGTWKRVEPRNPYAITASRYGAVGWSAEAMSAQACHDVLVERCAPWSSHVSTWTSGRCGPSSRRPPPRARIPASSSTPTSSSSPSRACGGRCGWPATGSWSPRRRSTTGSSRPAPCSSSTTRARRAGRPTSRR